jgi:hypothetical protein
MSNLGAVPSSSPFVAQKPTHAQKPQQHGLRSPCTCTISDIMPPVAIITASSSSSNVEFTPIP